MVPLTTGILAISLLSRTNYGIAALDLVRKLVRAVRKRANTTGRKARCSWMMPAWETRTRATSAGAARRTRHPCRWRCRCCLSSAWWRLPQGRGRAVGRGPPATGHGGERGGSGLLPWSGGGRLPTPSARDRRRGRPWRVPSATARSRGAQLQARSPLPPTKSESGCSWTHQTVPHANA